MSLSGLYGLSCVVVAQSPNLPLFGYRELVGNNSWDPLRRLANVAATASWRTLDVAYCGLVHSGGN